MDDWHRLADSAVESEETIAPSQSVTGEKYLATGLQWTIGIGWRFSVPRRRDSWSQSNCDW